MKGLCLLTLVCLPAQVLAQGDRWARQVDASLARATELARERGFGGVPIRLTGALSADEAERRPLPLQAGVDYLVVGVCDNDCHALNLVLSNPSGDEMVAERGASNAPMLQVRSTRSGAHPLRIIMGKCRISPCRYGLALFRKGQAD